MIFESIDTGKKTRKQLVNAIRAESYTSINLDSGFNTPHYQSAEIDCNNFIAEQLWIKLFSSDEIKNRRDRYRATSLLNSVTYSKEAGDKSTHFKNLLELTKQKDEYANSFEYLNSAFPKKESILSVLFLDKEIKPHTHLASFARGIRGKTRDNNSHLSGLQCEDEVISQVDLYSCDIIFDCRDYFFTSRAYYVKEKAEKAFLSKFCSIKTFISSYLKSVSIAKPSVVFFGSIVVEWVFLFCDRHKLNNNLDDDSDDTTKKADFFYAAGVSIKRIIECLKKDMSLGAMRTIMSS